MERTRSSIVAWTLTAATVTLLVHAQIEMTFFDPGSVTWMMCVVGLAGGVVSSRADRPRPAMGVAAATVVLVIAGYVSYQAALATRARLDAVEAARLVHSRASNRPHEAAQREAAAALLIGAHSSFPDPWLFEEAARQMIVATELTDDDSRRETLANSAVGWARIATSYDRPTAFAVELDAVLLLQRVTGGGWVDAIWTAELLTQIDPHGVAPWLRLGDVLWESGDHIGAAAAYRRALDNDANLELDPLRQMSDRDRRLAESRA